MPVHDGHVAVADNHIETLILPGLQRTAAIIRQGDIMPQHAQLLFKQHQVGGVVVDDQNAQLRTDAVLRSILGWQGCHATGVYSWQVELNTDPGALTKCAAQRQAPTHEFAQCAADHQPQAGTLLGALMTGLHKGAEQAGLVFEADADTGVFHVKLQVHVRV